MATVVARLAGSTSSAGDPTPGVTIAGTVVQDGALIVGAAVARSPRARPTPRMFGLRRVSLEARGPVDASARWVGFVRLLRHLGRRPSRRSATCRRSSARRLLAALIVVAVLICVVAPIAEELFFRGFLFSVLRRWLGVAGGAVLTGVIFGVIHCRARRRGRPGPARRVRRAAVRRLLEDGLADPVHGAARAQQRDLVRRHQVLEPRR